MTVTPATTGFSSGLTQSTSSLANNFDTFLTLLTAQLQAQDPLNPMDTNEFTQQLVQFSGVEQQIRSNQSLENLTNLMQASAGAASVNYLGQTVLAETNGAFLTEGGARWTYDLPRAAEEVKLTVRDDRGRVVFGAQGGRERGENTFNWDGKDGGGRVLPDGVYRLTVEAKGAGDQTIAASLTRKGEITEIDLSSGAPVLLLGGVPVEMEKIKRLKTQATLNF
jgi:flagellar basal-body rod modification protein FlgD